MAKIYTNSQGRQVYDDKGQTFDAKTGQVVGTAPLPTLSGTEPTLPEDTNIPSTFTLPDTEGEQSPILSFAQSLDAAVNLARKSRNASSLDIMKPFQGTVAASDFNSILGNLNQASDTTSKDLIKRAIEVDTPVYDTFTMDGNLYQVQKDKTGKIVGSPELVQAGSGAETPTKSGKLIYTAQDKSEDSQALEQSRGDDGYVNSAIYQELYKLWIDSGGTLVDFLKEYPPKNYVNPNDDSVPVFLKPPKGAQNDFDNL